MPGHVAQSVGHLTLSQGPGLDTRSGSILLFLLPLIQEEHLSVIGETFVHEVLVNRLGDLNLPSEKVWLG